MVAQTTTIRTPLVTEIRDAMESLAADHINGQVDDGWVMLHLIDRRPDLSPWARWALWEDLCTAYTDWDKAEGGDVNWDQVEPELRDSQVYAEAMRAALDEQLDQLVDNYVISKATSR